MSQDVYEKLGVFYLGREHDLESGETSKDLVLYDSKDLTTHGVCVGMTGSGKTGLCLGLIEEAAMDGIPVLAVDPKGDLANLLLTFPDLKAADFKPWIDPSEATRKGKSVEEYAKSVAALWKKGLAEWDQDGKRIAALKEKADFAVYTPGGSAGIPLTILKSFDAPPPAIRDNREAMQDRVEGAVSGLLALLDIDADPVRSREHILISNILSRAWTEGTNLDLPQLIRQIQVPPFSKIGVFDLESFFPEKDRFDLSLSINGLLASPGFAAWMEGQPLNVGELLYQPNGKPRVAVISIAHLSETERMFFVTILLNEVLAWVRTQPGTSSLRALLYMDEIFGYFPPLGNPPSKKPMLTLLKQARAHGLGVMLATQNPVDLDYKGLSNTGTWFIGRLQTERDKMRVLEGLEGASNTSGAAFDRGKMEQTLAGLGSRVFLLHNVHEDGPVVFHTRWAMSYLRGPMTHQHISTLMKDRKAEAQAASPAAASAGSAPSPEQAKTEAENTRPILPPGIEESFLSMISRPGKGNRLLYRPSLVASIKLHYTSTKGKVDEWVKFSYSARLPDSGSDIDWAEATKSIGTELDFEDEPWDEAGFSELPPAASKKTSYTTWLKELKSYLYQEEWLKLYYCADLKAVSDPGQSEGEFRGSLRHQANELRDTAVEKIREKYHKKADYIKERIRKAEQKLDREQEQYRSQKMSTAISFGTTILGALFGRKSSAISKAGTAARGFGRASKERGDIQRAEDDIRELQDELRDIEDTLRDEVDELEDRFDPAELELEVLEIRPRKTDITINDFGLAWQPWSINRDGIAESLF